MLGDIREVAFVNSSMVNPNDEDEPEICGICLDDIKGEGLEHMFNSKVSHRFHTKCVKPWLEEHQSCPLCRDRVTSINGEPLTNDRAGDQIAIAAFHGDNATVRFLLRSGTISEEQRGHAVVAATNRGHVQVVRLLLDRAEISQTNRENAVIDATSAGHVDIVRLLLSSGTITEYKRGWAVYWAASNGHFAIVRLLLSSGTISEEDRSFAAAIARDNGHYRTAALVHFSRLAKTATEAAPALALVALGLVMSYMHYADQHSEEQT
jgi:hypothetical protein